MRHPLLSVCTNGSCQNRCKFCAHHGMQEHASGYNMPLEDISRLIARCKEIDLQFERISFGGPGEPLLWPHINDAVRLLSKSGITSRVQITSNGHALDRIADDVWGMPNPVEVSVYGYPLNEKLMAKPNVMRMGKPVFWGIVKIPAPCFDGVCHCPGMMYYRGKMFPHCGPVAFDAANAAGMDPMSLGVDLDKFEVDRGNEMKLPCRWCRANAMVEKKVEPWSNQ